MQGELFLCFFFAIYRVALKVNKMYEATVHHYFMLLLFSYINVKGNQKWTIQRNWQQDTRRRQKKTNTQHNICWTPLCANKCK